MQGKSFYPWLIAALEPESGKLYQIQPVKIFVVCYCHPYHYFRGVQANLNIPRLRFEFILS